MEMIVFFVIPLILIVAGGASYFIAARLHRSLVKSENKNALLFTILTAMGCFLLITVGIYIILLMSFPFER